MDIRCDFFISYKHDVVDSKAAAFLQNTLERYRIPKKLRKKTDTNKFVRVFRDKTDLSASGNLTADICKQIESVEYLLLICSPRSKASEWVNKEIELFLENHDKQHIIPILIEGEPSEAFPDSLVTDGVEPLAVDCRGKGIHEICKNIKKEKLRFISPLLSCSYDELIQRNRSYRNKRIAFLTGIVALTSILFAIFLFSKNTQISKLNQDLLQEQAGLLAKESTQLMEKGKREEALTSALEGLEKARDSSEARLALESALGLYRTDSKYSIIPQRTFRMNSVALSTYDVDEKENILLSMDMQGTFYFWDLSKVTSICKFDFYELLPSDILIYWNNTDGFLLDDHCAFLRVDDICCCIDYISREIVWKKQLSMQYDQYHISANRTEIWMSGFDGSWYEGDNDPYKLILGKLDLSSGEEMQVATKLAEEIYPDDNSYAYDVSLMLSDTQDQSVWIVCDDTVNSSQYLMRATENSFETVKTFSDKKIRAIECIDEEKLLFLTDIGYVLLDDGLYHLNQSYNLELYNAKTQRTLWSIDGDVFSGGIVKIFIKESDIYDPATVITVVNRTELLNVTMKGEVLSKYAFAQPIRGWNETNGDMIYLITQDGNMHIVYKRQGVIRDNKYGYTSTGIEVGMGHFIPNTMKWVLFAADGRDIYTFSYESDPDLESIDENENGDMYRNKVSPGDDYIWLNKDDGVSLLDLHTKEILVNINSTYFSNCGFIDDYAYWVEEKKLILYSLTEHRIISTYEEDNCNEYIYGYEQIIFYRDQEDVLNAVLYCKNDHIIHLYSDSLICENGIKAYDYNYNESWIPTLTERLMEQYNLEKNDLGSYDISLLDEKRAILIYEENKCSNHLGNIAIWNYITDEIHIIPNVSVRKKSDLVLSPNGEYLAVIGTDDVIHIIDLETTECINEISDNESNSFLSMFFSPDSQYLYAQIFYFDLVGFDIKTGEEVMSIQTPSKSIYDYAFFKGGENLVIRYQTYTDDAGTYTYSYQGKGEYKEESFLGFASFFTEKYAYYWNNQIGLARIPIRSLEQEIQMAIDYLSK